MHSIKSVLKKLINKWLKKGLFKYHVIGQGGGGSSQNDHFRSQGGTAIDHLIISWIGGGVGEVVEHPEWGC